MDILDRLSLEFFGWLFPWLCLGAAKWLHLAWKRGNASVGWPATRGEVLCSAVEHDGDGYTPHVEYCYWVDGQRYDGETITYRGYSCDRRTVESYVARFPEKSDIPVFYDPHSPEIAVLERGVERRNYMRAVIVLLVLFAVGIGMNIVTIL